MKKPMPPRKVKTYQGDWYSINSIFGNDWAQIYILCGGREAGKSYSAMRWAIKRKLKGKEKVKLYWFRLTEASQKKLLLGGAADLIDPDLRRIYGIKTQVKGNSVQTYKEEVTKSEDGREKRKKKDVKEFCRVLACSTFYNDKGVGYFDKDFDGEYVVILDEMNRESNEQNRFDIVYAFTNQLENVLRSVTKKVRVILIGNTLDEASDILSAFNFIPDGFGRFYLKRQRVVIDNIAPSEKYKERRKEALANRICGEVSTFTNEVEIDRSLLVNKRKAVKISSIIKFGKSKSLWFSLYQGGVIKGYAGESCNDTIAMLPYMDEIFDQRRVDMIRDVFNVRGFTFTNLSTFKRFQKQLRLLKK